MTTKFKMIQMTAALGMATVASAFSVPLAQGLDGGPAPVGGVFTETNDAAHNGVAMYRRAKNGDLTAVGEFSTGGMGTGHGLGSQGSVVLSQDRRWLFAVNAGSNDVSVFSVEPRNLHLVGKFPSGGLAPISVTQHDDLLYVLNGGNPNNITGFRIGDDGHLTQIDGSTRPLSAPMAGPAEVKFSKDGDILIVSEKATNLFSTFTVDDQGVGQGPHSMASSGMTPYGFDFGRRGRIFVSEAFGGTANLGAFSSYGTDENGGMNVITGTAADHETAPCWVVVTRNGRFAYTANTGSSTVSGYAIHRNGSVVLLNGDGVTGSTGAGTKPIDVDESGDGKYLYVLTAGTGSIAVFRIGEEGDLTVTHSVLGIPATWAGLAAY